MSVKLVSNVLVPAWILVFGFISLSVPPLGVAASVWMFLVGGVAIPALMMAPLGGRPAPVPVVVEA